MKELICIVCPQGCHLKVDEENGCAVTGNSCPRGAEYGKAELTHPTRVVTSTVKCACPTTVTTFWASALSVSVRLERASHPA